ncbi:alpha/beta fold hydrolase [Variovorax sp. RCC_210]|uniref:alpha/beta fold hydrolase n=1 Tax=Variovorax sp. RCC_210 TaxID=3239217 RepID=UPI003525D5B0
MRLQRSLLPLLMAMGAQCALAQGMPTPTPTLNASPAPAAASAAAPALPYKLHTVTTPDGVKLHVQEWGNAAGPEIVFIHGFMQSYLSWRKQFDSDLAKTFRIVTYDMRGHGFSDKPQGTEYYTDSKRWADELKAVIEQTGMKRPVLVGWSYAGRVLGDYLMTYGDSGIAGIDFVDASTNGPLNAKAPAGAIAPGLVSPDEAVSIEATRAFLRACFSTQPTAAEFETMLGFNTMAPGYVRRAMSGRPAPYEAALKTVKVPVLVTHGIEDKAVLLDVGRYTAATVPGARLSQYPGVGHAPFWEDAARFNRELGAFVLAAQAH